MKEVDDWLTSAQQFIESAHKPIEPDRDEIRVSDFVSRDQRRTTEQLLYFSSKLLTFVEGSFNFCLCCFILNVVRTTLTLRSEKKNYTFLK